MNSPIPEDKNSRFWLFRDKFVIVEAAINIIVQATAFTRVFFSTSRFKKLKSNWLPQNRVFFNHPSTHSWSFIMFCRLAKDTLLLSSPFDRLIDVLY